MAGIDQFRAKFAQRGDASNPFATMLSGMDNRSTTVPTGTMTAGDTTLRDRLTDLMSGLYGGNDPKAAQSFGRGAAGLADYTPGVGQALSADDALRAANKGDWSGAALAGLGAVPEIGPEARALASGEKAAAKTTSQIEKLGGSTLDYDIHPHLKRMDVVNLETDPEFRGQGNARRLMEGLTSKADRDQFAVQLLSMAQDDATSDPRLKKFYQSLGFKPVEKDPYGGTLMRRPPGKMPTQAPVPAAPAPTRDDLAQVTRPPQEKSGVFDYGASYPPRDLGVERFRPKKVPERTTDLLSRPDVYDKMVAGVERGTPVKDWYETGPLRKSFEDQLGPAGLNKFDQFIDAVAATSPRSDVGTNVRNASYYYGKAQPRPGQNSIPSIADLPPKNPKPYGHLAQNLHRMNAEKTVFPGGQGLDFKANAKPIAFAANLKGDPSVATIDTHAFRAPAMAGADPRFLERQYVTEKGVPSRNIMDEVASGAVPMQEALGRGAFWQSKPLPTEYAAHEDYYKKIGQELGLTPAETQASGWVGHGGTTGLESAPKSFMDFVEERILKTSRDLKMDPKDVWRMAVSGKMPLLSAGGAALGAGALSAPRSEGKP